MEGWTDYFTYVSKTFTDSFGINMIIVFCFFHVFIFMGGYYLMNLFLAVVWSQFSEIERNNKKSSSFPTKGKLAEKILTYQLNEVEGKNHVAEEDESKMSEEKKIDLLREKTIFIESDPAKIPISYKTINDLFLMESLTPRESFLLKQRIGKEAEKAEEQFSEEKQQISKEVAGLMKYSLLNSVSMMEKNLLNEKKYRKSIKGEEKKHSNKDINSFLTMKKPKKILFSEECVLKSIEKALKDFEEVIKNDEKEKEEKVEIEKKFEWKRRDASTVKEITKVADKLKEKKDLNESSKSFNTENEDEKYIKKEYKKLYELHLGKKNQRESNLIIEKFDQMIMNDYINDKQKGDNNTISEANSSHKSSQREEIDERYNALLDLQIDTNKKIRNFIKIEPPIHNAVDVVKNFKKNKYYYPDVEDKICLEDRSKISKKNLEEIERKPRLYDDLEISDAFSEKMNNLNDSEQLSVTMNKSFTIQEKIFDFEDNVNKKYANLVIDSKYL